MSCSNEEPRSAPSAAVSSGGIPDVPVKGMVTMLDIGATECIPCKMMAPIMEELEKEYHGKAAIVFIDVWKHREQGPKYGIRAIPTQIFYDKEGKEVYRHEGFMDKESIVAELRKLGVE
ncbi:thioredoxin family protein [Desulfoferrobacter suflitae]|uniref:thioredoxin family protein n=1 Tax=Desulfoferrobacter suflitae TaxID=2865782 RepID=UPI0033901511